MNKQGLENDIKRHNELYWSQGKPEISDYDYDELIRLLQQIDPDNSLIKEIHTPKVLGNKKVKHLFPMLSLDKVYSPDELIKWCKKVSRSEDEVFLFEPKYDGCSAELTSNILSTRGDGIFGENVTHVLSIMTVESGNSKTIALDCNKYIRGEILIKKSTFEKIKGTYKTPRNMCAGILNRDKVDTTNGLVLTLVDFNFLSWEYTLKEIKNSLDWEALIQGFKKLDYPMDGVVVKVKDQEYGKSLGITSHHSKSEMSLKFTNPTGETTLLGVEFSSGKNKLTPIGKVKPVEINGVTVSNVNLHNYKYIIDNEIYINDTVMVERAGDVIPDIQSSKPTPGKERIQVKISVCPVCNYPTNYIEPEIVCSNKDCPGKHLARLMDSIRRIGIERLGEPTLKKIIGLFKSPIDLTNILELGKEDALKLEGFADASATNLIYEINVIKRGGVFEWQLLSCLNLHGIGETLSKELLRNNTLDDLRQLQYIDFTSIDGVGPERAKVLVDGLKENSDYIDRLLTILPIKKERSTSGLTFALTGKMALGRKEITKIIEMKGGVVKGITKETDYLVCNDPDSKSSKMKKATKLGVKIISVDQLYEIIGHNINM